ncbi:putative kinetochore protein spc24 [Mitosporidium daphniae]
MASPASSSGSGGSSAWTIQQSLDEPRQLILALLPKFKSNSDVTHILSLKAQMDAISEETKKKLNASMENIAAWIAKLEAARLDSVRPPNLTHEKHLERLASLESGKFALAKQIRDAEIAIESFELQLFQAQQELHNLKKENMEPVELSEFELRLRIYRSLGVSLLDDIPTATDSPPSIRVRVKSMDSNDIHLIRIDGDRSSFEYTNSIWDLCSSPVPGVSPSSRQ